MKAAETKAENRTLLWLDDTRNPFLNDEGKVPSFFDAIHWVVNYDQFTAWISKFGLPEAISFDHDLADEHYTPAYFWNDYEESKKFQEWRSQFYRHKTGEDCAKWLVAYCNGRGEELPIVFVHSANPVGADKIMEALKT